LFSGDFSQNTARGEIKNFIGANGEKVTYQFSTERNNFAHVGKFGTSLRTDNQIKDENNAKVKTLTSLDRNSLLKDFGQPINLGYLLNDEGPDAGLFGELL